MSSTRAAGQRRKMVGLLAILLEPCAITVRTIKWNSKWRKAEKRGAHEWKMQNALQTMRTIFFNVHSTSSVDETESCFGTGATRLNDCVHGLSSSLWTHISKRIRACVVVKEIQEHEAHGWCCSDAEKSVNLCAFKHATSFSFARCLWTCCRCNVRLCVHTFRATFCRQPQIHAYEVHNIGEHTANKVHFRCSNLDCSVEMVEVFF